MGSILLIAAACNVSPLFCSGTENEKKMIRNPQEIEQYYGRVLIWFHWCGKDENEPTENLYDNAIKTHIHFFLLI